MEGTRGGCSRDQRQGIFLCYEYEYKDFFYGDEVFFDFDFDGTGAFYLAACGLLLVNLGELWRTWQRQTTAPPSTLR